MKIKSIICLSLFLITLVTPVISAHEKRGEIVAVNDNLPSILFDNAEEIKEYSLALNNNIKLNGREVSINALKKIKDNVFQEAIIKTNASGEIVKIESFYQAIPVVIKKIKKNEIVFKHLNKQEILKYEIRKDITVKKNNQVSKLEHIIEGEQGLLILGINDRVRKIVLHNYSQFE